MKHDEIIDKEISWDVLEVPVTGTVTAPKDGEAHPAVVFLAGSGPTDRDWCSPLLPGTNGSVRILAKDLARHGYVTLRYDKLGSGPHVKEYLPKFAGRVGMQTFADELCKGIEAFLSQNKVDRSRLYALTNSEGAIHACELPARSEAKPFQRVCLDRGPGETNRRDRQEPVPESIEIFP